MKINRIIKTRGFLVIGIIAGASIFAMPANACLTYPPHIERKIERSHERDRRRADVVVKGTWVVDEVDQQCDQDRYFCRAKIVPHKVVRGKRRTEYIVYYDGSGEVTCDTRRVGPVSGSLGTFYIEKLDNNEFSLIDMKLKD